MSEQVISDFESREITYPEEVWRERQTDFGYEPDEDVEGLLTKEVDGMRICKILIGNMAIRWKREIE